MFDFDVRESGELRETVGGGTTEALALSAIRLEVPIGEIPRGPALTVSPEASVAAAMAVMRRRGARGATVVRNHRPVGVVTDRDILQMCGDTHDLRVFSIGSVMVPCDEPLREDDSVAQAFRQMCARRQWYLPMVCRRGLFLGALDIADISLWLRDRMTLMSMEAAFGAGAATS